MDRQLIECDKPADRDLMVAILAKNGYSVRIRRIKKETGNTYRWYVEYWRE